MECVFVGNLPWKVSEEQIADLFATYGIVFQVRIVRDRETGRSRGFGFVDMEQGVKLAIENLNGFEFAGRKLRLGPANSKIKERPNWTMDKSRGPI